MMRQKILLPLAFLTIWCATAQAQIKMEIVGPGSRLSAIALPALKDAGGDSDHEVSNVFVATLTRNLELSGYFRILDPHAFVEDSQASGFQLGKFNFADWSSLNTEFLVKGGASVEGGKTSLEVYLYDVAQQRQMIGKRYSGERGEIRRMARRFADSILQALTGQRGPFDAKVALVSTRGGRFKEIYAQSVDGLEQFRVTNNRTINLFPSFGTSPNDLLYTSFKSGVPTLYMVNLGSQREIQITTGLGQIVGGTMTADGNVVAAIERNGATNLFLLSSSGALIRPLTQGRSINVNASLSADGSKMAFTSDRAGTPQVYIMNVNGGGEPKRITFQGAYNTNPALSPKGDIIAYQSRNGGGFDLYSIGAEGGNPSRLTQSNGSSQHPAWSPDGRYLIFSSTREGSARLYIMRVDSGKITSAVSEENGNDTNPTWSGWMGE